MNYRLILSELKKITSFRWQSENGVFSIELEDGTLQAVPEGEFEDMVFDTTLVWTGGRQNTFNDRLGKLTLKGLEMVIAYLTD